MSITTRMQKHMRYNGGSYKLASGSGDVADEMQQTFAPYLDAYLNLQ